MSNCPYCRKSGNLYFGIYSRKYYRCGGCDLIYRTISESYDDAVTTYREKYFDKYSAEQLKGERVRLYDHILDLITVNQEQRSLLDVGTGCGFFLVAAQKRQWEVKGVEPSIQSVEVARRQNDLNVFRGTLKEYVENSQFDVITFINVLDHSTMPWLEIARAKELLRSGGMIYLRFPNGLLHSRIYRIAYKYGLANTVSKLLVFHNYSFTTGYINRLLNDHGFVQITILNSPTSEGDPHELFPGPTSANYVKKLIYSVAECIATISCGRLLLGTSLEVTALKPS